MTRTAAAAAILALLAAPALAEPQRYAVDAAHSDAMFSWSHAGFSTTRGMAWDVEGEILFDPEDPAASSVTVSLPISGISVTPEFEAHLLQSGDFFAPEDPDPITFASTGIEVTGEDTAMITGDLTINGETREVVLDTTMNQMGSGPRGNTIAGFTATTAVDRTEFGLGMFAPVIGPQVEVVIQIEASPAEG